MKIDFDWVACGNDLHVPAEGMFITLRHVRRMYYEYVKIRQSDVRV